MKNAGRLLLGLLLVWTSCWLGLGVLCGQPTLLLHPTQASETQRVLYLVLLYSGMVGLLVGLWRRYPPAVEWGSLSVVARIWPLGLGAVMVQRLCLLNAWHPDWPSTAAWWSAALLAPALAVVEEAVFRGYLYGVLRQQKGRLSAALGVSALFALVHLFRPGGLPFKLAYAVGLILTSLVLIILVERAGLWAAVAMHSVWISANVLDPPGHVTAGLWSGLQGEPAAGLCSWILLGLLGATCWKWLGDASVVKPCAAACSGRRQ